MTHDAIVIGAGPAGSSAALTLARQGWAVALVEKAEFPRRKVCGEYISASNLALLDRLEIGDAWRADAGPEIRRVGFFSAATCVAAPMPSAQGGFGRALGRDVLDLLLLEAARAAGVAVFQPFRAVSIDADGDAQAVQVESRNLEATRLRAPVIIAAHGSWEPGKLPSQPERAHAPSDLLGFKAHFTDSALPEDLMPLLVFPGGYGGMVTADHGRTSISCCIRRSTLAELREANGQASAGETVSRHVRQSCKGVDEALRNARLDGQWLAAGPIRPGIRPCYERDIFRVGNVAGESHPIIAEGISMALQSGWLLAAELVRQKTDRDGRQAAGRRYQAAWHRLFAIRVHAAAAIAQLALRPAGAAFMRTAVAGFPHLLTLGSLLSGKTKSMPDLN